MASVEDAGAGFLKAVAQLTPLIAGQRRDIEHGRRLPAPLVEAMRDAGLFSLWLPAALGGPQLSVHDFIRIIEEISRADGSTGWCAAVGAAYSRFAGYLPEPVARGIYGDRRAILAGTINPSGRAVAVPGGYRVTGQWAYGSGIEHSNWAIGNCIVFDGDVRRVNDDGSPVVRMMFFPTRDVEVSDTWRVSGLRGTGSHDYRVADLFVSEERSIAGFDAPPVQPGTLYALPLITVFAVSIAAVPLGIARAAIDALIELAGRKTPMGSQALLRDKPTIQAEIGRAEAVLRSARAFLFESVQELWEEAETGNLSLDRRARVRLACAQVAAAAKEVTARMFDAGGGTALYESGPLERCLRDVQAAAQHIAVSTNNFELGGRVLLGLGPGTPRF